YAQAGRGLVWDAVRYAFVPDGQSARVLTAGAIRGADDAAGALADGFRVAAECFGLDAGDDALPRVIARQRSALQPLWEVPLPDGVKEKRFVDFQNDVTADDVHLAHREGYLQVEHLKRYTTLGMGTDQGRTSNINGLAILAHLLGKDIPAVGTTRFRPPYQPITMGAITAGEIGPHLSPLRRTALHDWHVEHGAVMMNSGVWQRAAWYAQEGEGMWDAIYRETRNVRANAGICDVSTLGKIDVQGRDAATFLERIFINRWQKLGVGRVRYGVALREDGFVNDDGTVTRLAANHFYVTTTTAHAAQMMAQMEYYAQTVWPELDVHLVSITDQWAGMAVAGPKSRAILQTLTDGDLGNEATPYMSCTETTLADVPLRLLRVSFSGELGYELHVPSGYARHVWQAIVDAGADEGLTPYGLEAMGILRIEKGFLTHAEIDGRVNADDLGVAGMMKADGDFVGKRSQIREAFEAGDRKVLVGLKSLDGKRIPRGGHLVANASAPAPLDKLGHVTSQCFSPHVDAYIGLALVKNGRDRHGETLTVTSPLTGENVRVELCPTVFVDPEGERVRA
ncbi:unnamed protein product, partial [Cyprideis torosa]